MRDNDQHRQRWVIKVEQCNSLPGIGVRLPDTNKFQPSFARTGLSYVANNAQFPKCPRSAHCQSWQHPGFFQTQAAAVTASAASQTIVDIVPEFAKISHNNRKLHNAIPERKSCILQLFDNERAYTTWRTTRRKTIFPDVRTCDQNLMVCYNIFSQSLTSCRERQVKACEEI